MTPDYPVCLIRLTSGEEILAQVTNAEDAEYYYNVVNPILMVHTGEGKMGFVTWMPYMNQSEGIDIPTGSILFLGTPIDSFIQNYNAHVNKNGTTLAMPTEPSLVL